MVLEPDDGGKHGLVNIGYTGEQEENTFLRRLDGREGEAVWSVGVGLGLGSRARRVRWERFEEGGMTGDQEMRYRPMDEARWRRYWIGGVMGWDRTDGVGGLLEGWRILDANRRPLTGGLLTERPENGGSRDECRRRSAEEPPN